MPDTPACTSWHELAPTVTVSREDFENLLPLAIPFGPDEEALVERMWALLDGEH